MVVYITANLVIYCQMLFVFKNRKAFLQESPTNRQGFFIQTIHKNKTLSPGMDNILKYRASYCIPAAMVSVKKFLPA